jgi:multidrug efflux system membrane fusion protein
MNSVPPTEPAIAQSHVNLRRPSRTRRVVWFLVMAVIGAVILGGFAYFEYIFKPKMMAAYFGSMVPPPTPVATAKAAAESVPRYLESIGTATAVHQVSVNPEVPGRVSEIRFESGAEVKAGQVLVQLDDSTERADLANFQAQSRLATSNLARAQQLAAKQFGSRQQVDEVQSELDQANAGISRAQATINQKVIKAPFGGMLGIRQIDLGQYLTAGAPIVTLTDLDELYIDFTLPEQDRTLIAIGQKVEVRADAYPDRVFTATLQTIEPQVDPNMRALKLQALLSNPDHALQPGMYVRVHVLLPDQPNVVTVPETAIDYTVYGDSVYIVKEGEKGKDGKPTYKVDQVFVTLGDRNGGKVSILKGVADGDIVVTGGQLKLHNGAAVSLSDDKSLLEPQPETNE